MKKNLLVAQSGGPTAVINASLSGVIWKAMQEEKIDKIYGAQHGIAGVFSEEFVELKACAKKQMEEHFPKKEEEGILLSPFGDFLLEKGSTKQKAAYFSRLAQTPAAALGSCRLKLKNPQEDPREFQELLSVFKAWNIGYFLYIGGNDSMDTAWKLSAYCKEQGEDIVVVGVPKTIDNDLEGIDHCPGFGSSAKYIAASLLELERECLVYDTKYVMIVEMMGRNAGWLTAAAALSAEKGSIPYLIYLEEQSFSKEQFQKDVEKALEKSDQVMVAVSEGIKDSNGKFLYTYGREEGGKDAFGHSIAGGAGGVLEQMILEKMSVKTRSIEFNLLQRCAGHLLSKTDVEESFLLGAQAVELAVLGENGKMSSLRRKPSGENSFVGPSGENSFEKSSGKKDLENSNAGKSDKAGSGYAVEYSAVPLSEVANREKKIPLSWIGKDGHSLEEEALDYLRPLILGEYSCDFVDGLPQYISFFEKSGK